ncbi:MAG TPA: extracellular solute-binding protein [candidate division Zixibacteria bacterium]|nr:extracellular solute-binding protein [candidate division Zixibacteria bacterium]
MSRLQVKIVIALLAAFALSLGTAARAAAQAVQLPTGWKTPSELYAMLAKLPRDRLDQVLYEGAKKEGVVVYASPAEENQVGKLLEGFMARYPGIKGQSLGGQQEDISNRILAEARAGRSSFDLISVGTFLGQYREARALAELHDLVGNDRYPPQFRGKDFYSWNLLSMVIAYNTNLVKPAEAPKGYMEILDPKWRGKVAVDNSPDTWMFGMLHKWGFDKTYDYQKRLIQEQKALIRKGHTNQTNLLVAGAFPLAIELYSYKIADMKHKGAPVDMILPREFVAAEATGVGVSSRAAHPYAALLLARFHVDPEGGQKILAQFGRVMAHPDTRLKYEELQQVTAKDTLDRMSLLTAEELVKYAKPYAKIIKEIYNPAFRGGK